MAARGDEMENGFIDETIEVERYNGANGYVLQMTGYLDKYLYDDLFGVYVHGSLGTCEEIAYSDFDALVIIKNNVLENPGRLAYVAKKLYGARKFMHKMDPLQHHGWFVLTENDLEDYPQNYFPKELFKYAKSLFPVKGFNIKFSPDPLEQDSRAPFYGLAMSMRVELENEDYPRDMYQLKGLLSRFMLLPALYCLAKNGKGIFKKFSFAEAKKDFSDPVWRIMDEVSAIRREWRCSVNILQRYLISRTSPMLLRFKRKIGPKVPADIKKKLSLDFYEAILDLIEQMEEKLHEIKVN